MGGAGGGEGVAWYRRYRIGRHSGAMPPGPREARPDDRLRIEPQMRNCASGNLEIPGSALRTAPE